jgi:putative addiction module component (TIGR02574 family)
MATVVDDLMDQLSKLSTDDQAKIVRFLLDSIDEAEEEPGWEEAWREEIERRDRLVEEGKMECVPFEEAMAKLKAKYE